jgi:hypothetical protein
MTYFWTSPELNLAAALHPAHTYAEIAIAINAKFGTERTAEAVGIICRRRLKLRRGWSDDEIKIALDNIDKTAAQTAKMLPGRTARAVEQKRRRLRDALD